MRPFASAPLAAPGTRCSGNATGEHGSPEWKPSGIPSPARRVPAWSGTPVRWSVPAFPLRMPGGAPPPGGRKLHTACRLPTTK